MRLIDRKILVGAAAGAAGLVLAAIVAAFLVLEFGWFDIAAGDAHLPLVRWFVHHVMIRGVGKRAPHIRVPATVPAAAVAAGLCEYQQHCQMCHGGPAVARDAWANGLNPPPPYLIGARGNWTPQELYWIIAKGVKMTAMPSWKMSMSDKQIWSTVAYLENMPRVPAGAYRKLSESHQCPAPAELMNAMAGVQIPPASELPRRATR
jgi:mono/diheme cytochrome c family protein